MIVGPAGAGKSFLVRQWSTAEIGRSLAWVAAGPAVADGMAFARELLAALSGPWGEETLYEAGRRIEAGGERMGGPFLDAILMSSAGRPPTVVVVEDLHELPAVLVEELVWLTERAPGDLRFLFTSRAEVAGLHRLRSRGELAEIGPLDLALDPKESAELVERVSGVELKPEEVDDLWSRTEGWAVGVQLAAVAIRDRAPSVSVTDAMQRIDRHVGDYLQAEVVDRQPPELGELLRVSTLLDKICGPLCDSITGRSDSHRLLLELERRTLITPLDARGTWFRYHPLVSEAMRRHLRATDPARYKRTLELAAMWHMDQDDLESAVECLAAAESWNTILDLVPLHGWTAYERGEGAAVARWMHDVPVGLLRAHRQASFALVVIERFVGNAATTDALLDDVETRYLPGSRERAGLDIIRATGVSWSYPPEKALVRAEAAIAVLDAEVPPDEVRPGQMPDAFLKAVAVLAMGKSLTHLGRLDEARECYSKGLEDPSAYTAWRILTFGGLALLEAAAGRLSHAVRAAGQALEIAETTGMEDHISTAEATLAAGQVASERGELEEASRLLEAAEVRARRNRRSTVIASIVTAKVQLLLAIGDVEGAGSELARWKASNEVVTAASVLEDLSAVEAVVRVREGDHSAARRVLTTLDHSSSTFATAAELAFSTGDMAALRTAVGAWPQGTDVLGRLRHLIWQSIAAHQEARFADAGRLLASAAAMARPEGFVRVFLDAGPAACEIMASMVVDEPTEALGELQATIRPAPQPEPAPNLLSGREMGVLRLLPTALSNTEIAAELYISNNTLKTHLRRIYRKLDASNRMTAVERARALGIL